MIHTMRLTMLLTNEHGRNQVRPISTSFRRGCATDNATRGGGGPILSTPQRWRWVSYRQRASWRGGGSPNFSTPQWWRRVSDPTEQSTVAEEVLYRALHTTGGGCPTEHATRSEGRPWRVRDLYSSPRCDTDPPVSGPRQKSSTTRAAATPPLAAQSTRPGHRLSFSTSPG